MRKHLTRLLYSITRRDKPVQVLMLSGPSGPLASWPGNLSVVDSYLERGTNVTPNFTPNPIIFAALMVALREHGFRYFNGEEITVTFYGGPTQTVPNQPAPPAPQGYDTNTHEQWWAAAIACPGRTMSPAILVKACLGPGLNLRVLPYQQNNMSPYMWVPYTQE